MGIRGGCGGRGAAESHWEGSPRAGPGTHRGSSAGRHSTEWYKFFTATSHSRSTAVVLSALWSVATLREEGDNQGGWGAQTRTGQQTRTWALHPGSACAPPSMPQSPHHTGVRTRHWAAEKIKQANFRKPQEALLVLLSI